MEDALDAVWEFTHEPNISKNGKINSQIMNEMWDYENGTIGPKKRKRDFGPSQREPTDPQMPQSMNCELCGRNLSTDCPHES